MVKAVLRGLAEALNRPQGRVIQSACDAVLGDGRCGVNLDAPEANLHALRQAVEHSPHA